MRIEQPDAPNSPPKSPSPLELAIYNFEQAAKKHHALKAKNRGEESSKEEEKLDSQLKHELIHLRRERDRLSTLVNLQAQVDNYRQFSANISAKELAKENHHPTDKLTNYLRAVGEPKPSVRHDAHHIIPGKGRWLPQRMLIARLNLHLHGIGINDPINGAWLPRNQSDKGHWATPKAPAHKEIHRYNYEIWIGRKFLNSDIPKSFFLASLREIKHMLKYGGFPQSITVPKDINWRG